MRAGWGGRWCAALAAALVAVGFAGGQNSIAKTGAHASATLRVGLWTLWHDKEVTVAPVDGNAVMRKCDGCAVAAITRPVLIRAVGARLEIKGKGEVRAVQLAGAVTLAAHGERITLRNPVRIGARNGELVLAVTLPVESYVERVVASESGAGDSAESPEGTGNCGALVCAAPASRSRCLRFMRLDALPIAALGRECGTAGRGAHCNSRDRGGDAVVSWAAGRGVVSSELRRAHCGARRGLAWEWGGKKSNALAGFACG